jgi:hypothetical protein
MLNLEKLIQMLSEVEVEIPHVNWSEYIEQIYIWMFIIML